MSSVAKAFKNVVDTIADASWKRLFKVFIVVFFFLAVFTIGLYAYNVVSDKEMTKELTHKMMQEKKEEGIRDFVVTPKIQKDIDILLYTLNADRVFIFEFHNGKKNISGLPFKYADMTYEVANIERKVDRVYSKYQDVPLTMYKYPDYMYKQKLIICTIEEIEKLEGTVVNGGRSRGSLNRPAEDQQDACAAPHVVSVSFQDIRAEVLLHALEETHVYVSSGSACSSNHPAISGTLKAIGVEKRYLDATVRFSFSFDTTKEEIDECVAQLSRLLPMLRRYTPGGRKRGGKRV